MSDTLYGAQMAPTAAASGISAAPAGPADRNAIPAGVKGWSWGAFMLSWIWAIGNRTWIGLLALVPLLGLFVSIWLGIKGREMAWKNKRWDNVEHFRRVQRAWSYWGLGLLVFKLVVCLAVAVPTYHDYVAKARAAQAKAQAQVQGPAQAGL